MKQNKGTILKASVDFLKCLKKEVSKIPDLEKKHRDLELENRRMLQRIQQLESGISTLNTGGGDMASSSIQSQSFLQQRQNSWPQATLATLSSSLGGQPHELANAASLTPAAPISHQEIHAHINQGNTMLSQNQQLQNEPFMMDSDLFSMHVVAHVNKNSTNMVKREYSESPSQISSGLGSLTSPSPMTSGNNQYSHVLIENHKDPVFSAALIKDEVLSPQAMDICN